MSEHYTDDQTARDGVINKLHASGGELTIQALNRYSILTFARGHQAFSQLMEGLVDDGLVVFDNGIFRLTDQGREKASAASA